jgi:hypothetical protein
MDKASIHQQLKPLVFDFHFGSLNYNNNEQESHFHLLNRGLFLPFYWGLIC